MKLYKSAIGLLTALLCGACFVGCTEEATLDGADKVYITLNPSDITLRVGDTVRFSAEVANVSGAIIETPIKWSVLNDSVATILGDTAVICLPGSQGKSTKLKAELVNGQYGLANIIVTTHTATGINAVDTAGNIIQSYRSYASAHDSVVFTIAPKELLEDFTPTYTVEGVTTLENAMTIDKEKAQVVIHFSSPRKAGGGAVSVEIGGKKGSCEIQFLPEVFATFYGAKYAGMPYIDGGHPDKSTLPMYFAYLNETVMDINSVAEVRVAVNVQTGADEDIEAAYSSYRWETDEESSRVVTIETMKNEYFPDNGFDAVLAVRSIRTGTATFRCITPDTVLTAVFYVQDFTNDYPVNEIIVDKSSLEMVAGEEYRLQTAVEPMTSYAFHKPVVTVVDPTIAMVGEYEGNQVPITALAVGSTELILTANGKELRVPLTVREDILNVTWPEGNASSLFEGQSIEWNLNVMTFTGGPNPYEVIWKSTDENVVKATAGTGNKGVITAVAEGIARITAKVDDITSSASDVRVVAATDRTFDATNVDLSGSGIYFNENELELYITTTFGSVVKVNVMGTGVKMKLDPNDPEGGEIPDYNGTYNENLIVTIDDAMAEATGTFTIASGDDGYSVVNIDLVVNTGDKTFTVKATDMQIPNW